MNPKFSVIVPAADDEMATARTCSNLIYQGGKVPREVIVVSDGHAKWIRNVVRVANEKAKKAEQPCEFIYMNTPKWNQTGNPGRHLGLMAAKGEWVFFIDSGTCVTHHAFYMMDFILGIYKDPDLIVWDVIQLLDPVPWVHVAMALQERINCEKIGYWITGTGAAVRTKVAQKIGWPNVRASDWLFWDEVWKTFKKPVKLAVIPSTLTVAYAGYDHKRVREPMKTEVIEEIGFNMDYLDAAKKFNYEIPPEYMNGQSLPGQSGTDETASGSAESRPEATDTVPGAQG